MTLEPVRAMGAGAVVIKHVEEVNTYVCIYNIKISLLAIFSTLELYSIKEYTYLALDFKKL